MTDNIHVCISSSCFRQIHNGFTTSNYRHAAGLLLSLISFESIRWDLSLRLRQRALDNVHIRSIFDGRGSRLISNEQRTARAPPSVLFLVSTLSVWSEPVSNHPCNEMKSVGKRELTALREQGRLAGRSL